MPGKVRRIVTAVNDAGRSYILSDTRLPAELAPGEPLRAGLWLTDSAPASNAGTRDPAPDGIITGTPPRSPGGTVIRISDYPPDRVRRYQPPGSARPRVKTTPDRLAKNPGFHATDTVDYAVCLEGEIWAVMDEVQFNDVGEGNIQLKMNLPGKQQRLKIDVNSGKIMP